MIICSKWSFVANIAKLAGNFSKYVPGMCQIAVSALITIIDNILSFTFLCTDQKELYVLKVNLEPRGGNKFRQIKVKFWDETYFTNKFWLFFREYEVKYIINTIIILYECAWYIQITFF